MKLFCLASLYKQQTTKKNDYQKGDENSFFKNVFGFNNPRSLRQMCSLKMLLL